MNLAYILFPNWLKPEIFPGLPIRWYGLMYIVAFGIAYYLLQKNRKTGCSASEEHVVGFFTWALFSLIIGARLLSVLLYNVDGLYIRKPWLIFWPFSQGRFVGLQGMSYHGGVIGVVLGTWIYTKRHKLDWFELIDLMIAGIPLGYTFGRLGNFINGELWGRVTTIPWGMIFPHAPRFSTSLKWVEDIAGKVGLAVNSNTREINLPRHPSQLYEALFEGVVLWAVLWFWARKRKKFHGSVVAIYLIGYGLVRFLIEYVREPDAELGFPIALSPSGDSTALFTSFLNFTTGQILCFMMIVAGTGLYMFRAWMHKKSTPELPTRKLPPSAKRKKRR